MSTLSYLAAAVGFAIVAGFAALNWLHGGRAPHVTDDPSILLAEPPEGMTAATATIVDHQSTRIAFLAALVDLASRAEIRFRVEPEGHLVGIELHGGETSDPQIRLNRRRPIGEGEAWLLIQLKQAALASASQAGGTSDPAALLAGVDSMLGFVGFAADEQAGDDSPEARARREHGLLDGPPPDPEALAAALEQRSGQLPSKQQQAALANLGRMSGALQSLASIRAESEAFAAQVEAISGKPMSAADLAAMKAWAAMPAGSPTPPAGTLSASTPGASASPGDPPAYISGEAALHLGTPLFFGTFVESYARRHGWISGLSAFDRLRWHLIGAGEVALGLIALGLGGSSDNAVVRGLGLGVILGGVVTFLAAPAMAAPTAAGALMQAQIAAYRRTLALTFAAAQTIGDVVGASSLTWLDTPDQSIVWGIALGLRSEVEALLARTAQNVPAGSPQAAYQASWYTPDTHQPSQGAATMFSAIEAIGSQSGPIGH